MKYASVGLVFQWVLLTLAAFRLQHFVTVDDVPGEWIRGPVERRFGADSKMAELLTCPWCFGSWVTFAVFGVAAQFVSIPQPLVQAFAAAAVVGYAGSKE